MKKRRSNMIIVSQDKKSLINFDNMSAICVGHENETVTIVAFNNVSPDSFGGVLGEYKTEERAIKVLDNILNAAGLKMYKYQMPKK